MYDKLKAEADDIGWPRSYASDLEADKKRLEGDDPPTCFGWVLRVMGTDLLDVRMKTKNLEGYLRHHENNGAKHLYYIMHPDGRLTCLHFRNWCHWMRRFNAEEHGDNPEHVRY